MLLFCDGMDNWATIANVTGAGVWSTSQNPNGSFTKGASSGRFGGGGLSCDGPGNDNLNNGALIAKAFASTYATLVVSFAVNFGNNNVDSQFCTFRSGGVSQVAILRTPTTGTLRAYRSYDGGGGTQLGASTLAVLPSGWHWIGIKVTFHSSAGTVDIEVDGTSFLSLTGQNTSPVSGNVADGFDIGLFGGRSVSHLFDDVICNDTSGSGLTSLVADRRIYTQFPAGAGVNSQFTPIASTNSSQVNESPGHDGDTSYNSDSTSGHKDDFTHGTLASVSSIDAVVLKTYARKDDAGARSIIQLVLSSGTEGDGNTNTLTSSYQGFTDIFLTDPNTSAAWVKANWDSATFGYKNA